MKKEFEKLVARLPYIIIVAVAVFFVYINKLEIIKYLSILKPLWIGLVIAYILNIPMMFIEKYYDKILPIKFKKYMRPLSIFTIIIFSIVIVNLLIQIIVPQLIQTISQVVDNSNAYADALEKLINSMLQNFNIETVDVRKEMMTFITNIAKNVEVFLKSNIPSIINNTIEITASLFFSIGTFFVGFIISMYLLGSKEVLLRQLRSLIVALLDDKYSQKIFYISSKTNEIFKNFIGGQMMDCIALGTLCYIGMIIFGFPYPILISVLVTSLAIIPYFGAFSAMFIGSILMLPLDPMRSLMFIVYFVILQQLEGNFVYPRIVGDKVGLPGVWVLVSVILFSGIFGFAGLFFAVPVTAVIYYLVKMFVDRRLNEKNISIDEI